MSPMPALERLRRLLVVIPWVVEADGPLISEVAERFDYAPKELIDDLEQSVFFVGVHPFNCYFFASNFISRQLGWFAACSTCQDKSPHYLYQI